MKAVQAKDLVIGAIYSDLEVIDEAASLLEYKGIRASTGGLIYEHVGGRDSYNKGRDGFIGFRQTSFFPCYELSPSEIEQYLPSLSTDRDGLAITSEDQ